MLRRSERISKHINYKTFNLTGEKVYKESEGENISESEEIEQSAMADEKLCHLNAQTLAMIDDINDFVEENTVADIKFCIDDIDTAISRIEDLRSTFRERIREIKAKMKVEDCYD